MANGDTVDKILHAATVLFAERGFAETSLRTITSMADVNLAAVNYHFGSKKALIQAVFARVMEPFCNQLDKKMNAMDLDGGDVKTLLVAVVEAFVGVCKDTGESPERFARLLNLAYTQSQEHLRQFCNQRFGGTLERFIGLLKAMLPDLDIAQFYWRMNFMLGASLFSLSSFESIVATFGKQPGDLDLDDMLEHLIPAMTAMVATA